MNQEMKNKILDKIARSAIIAARDHLADTPAFVVKMLMELYSLVEKATEGTKGSENNFSLAEVTETFNGRRIAAIKLHRDRTGKDLRKAKETIDKIHDLFQKREAITFP